MNKYHEKDAELKLMELLLDIYSNKEISVSSSTSIKSSRGSR